MGRAVAAAFVIAVLLLLGAVLITTETPKSTLAALLTIAAGILLAGIVWAIFISAWRTKGWSLRHPGREEETDPDVGPITSVSRDSEPPGGSSHRT